MLRGVRESYGAAMPLHRRDLIRAGLAWALLLDPARALAREPVLLRVVGSADPPFRTFEPGRPPGGLYHDLINEAARRLGWQLVFLEVPWLRALKMLEGGQADLIVGPLRNPEREQYLSFGKVALPAVDKVFYTRPDARPLHELSDLQGLTIAVHRGKRYGGLFDQASGLQRVELNDYRTVLEMVARGRLDVALMPERQGDWMLRQLGLALMKQPLRLGGDIHHVAMSRLSPWLALQAELDQTLQAMKDDGSWRHILDRY